MTTDWLRISRDLYVSIYRGLEHHLSVHATFSDPDGTSMSGNGKPFYLTEWGIKESVAPLIRCELRDQVEHFYIAIINNSEDE